eukprot:1053121-Pleurochrysis_carterae.AAC.1
MKSHGLEKPTLTADCMALVRKLCDSFSESEEGKMGGGQETADDGGESDESDNNPAGVKRGKVSGRARVIKDASDEEEVQKKQKAKDSKLSAVGAHEMRRRTSRS